MKRLMIIFFLYTASLNAMDNEQDLERGLPLQQGQRQNHIWSIVLGTQQLENIETKVTKITTEQKNHTIIGAVGFFSLAMSMMGLALKLQEMSTMLTNIGNNRCP